MGQNEWLARCAVVIVCMLLVGLLVVQTIRCESLQQKVMETTSQCDSLRQKVMETTSRCDNLQQKVMETQQEVCAWRVVAAIAALLGLLLYIKGDAILRRAWWSDATAGQRQLSSIREAVPPSMPIRRTPGVSASPSLLISRQKLGLAIIPPVPPEFLCPIGLTVMIDPVITMAGNTYDRAAIEKWLERNPTDPLTRTSLNDRKLTQNVAIRALIMAADQTERDRVKSAVFEHCRQRKATTIQRFWKQHVIHSTIDIDVSDCFDNAGSCCLLTSACCLVRPTEESEPKVVQAGDLKIGDYIKTKYGFQQLVCVTIHQHQDCTCFTFLVGDDVYPLTCTGSHRIVTEFSGRRAKTTLAERLSEGDVIQCSRSGRRIKQIIKHTGTFDIVEFALKPDMPVEAFDQPSETILSKGRADTRRGGKSFRFHTAREADELLSIPETQCGEYSD